MKKTNLILTILFASASALVAGGARAADKSASDEGGKKVLSAEQAEKRAERMVKNAIALFEQKEDDRAVGMLEAVGRMFPDTKARFRANLELGRHFADKRDFDRAGAELRTAQRSTEEAVQAEALLLLGRLQVARGQSGDALLTLRKLTQDYPVSPFANEAFFTIGQIHFEARRWARAREAFEMVGTAVPPPGTNEVVLVEAGQRLFVHVNDKDLGVSLALGDRTTVELVSKSGDRETAELKPFGRGDGDFIASVPTSADKTASGDGVLTVNGADEVMVRYIDRNTESGSLNRAISSDAHVVSSGSIAFMDGALRQRVKGVFVGQPAVVRIRDLDLDAASEPNRVKATVKVQYRERPERAPGADPNEPPPPPAPDAPWLTRGEYETELVETGARTGIFTVKLTPVLVEEGTNAPAVKLAANELAVRPEDKVVVAYADERHLEGGKPVERSAEAIVLVGGSTEPQSIMAHANDPSTQAKKLLLEAQLLAKWGGIFKDTGLQANAVAKADEGLERVNEIFTLVKRVSLDRTVIEQAYEARWNLQLVKNDLHGAIQTCNALVRRYPDTLLADRAFLQIGNANMAENTRESRQAAQSVYNAILAMPNSPLKPEAQFRIGEIMEIQAREAAAQMDRKPDFSGAMVAFKRCADAYPNSSYAGESIKRVIDYFISIRDYTRAQETLERVFQDYPDAPWLDEMLLKWGVVCHRLGNREDAIAKFRRILEEYPGGNAARQATKFLQKLEN